MDGKEVDEGISEKNGRRESKSRYSVRHEAIFQMECIITVHINAIHLLYHIVEGDLQRREYALKYGSKYNPDVLHNQLLLLHVVPAICKKNRET